jgi:RNA polymerase sigma factor for flagellar operon FliA
VDADIQELIGQYMGFAQSLAQQVWRTAPHALDADELRAIAYLGLVDAADRWEPYCQRNEFDPDRLEFFKPFVKRRVYGSLMDAIRASDWATRSLRTRAKALAEAGADRGLSHEELAQRTGMSVDEVRNTVRGMAARPVSLEAEELDPDACDDVESSAFTASVLLRVVHTVQELPADQQTVIALHYWRGIQLQHIAKAMGITESRASTLHAAAVLAVHAAMIDAASGE